ACTGRQKHKARLLLPIRLRVREEVLDRLRRALAVAEFIEDVFDIDDSYGKSLALPQRFQRLKAGEEVAAGDDQQVRPVVRLPQTRLLFQADGRRAAGAIARKCEQSPFAGSRRSEGDGIGAVL